MNVRGDRTLVGMSRHAPFSFLDCVAVAVLLFLLSASFSFAAYTLWTDYAQAMP